MSRFYASIKGSSRGEATRTGDSKSGIAGHIRGWHLGARVSCYVDDSGDDVVSIVLTPGSNGDGHSKLIWSGTRADYEALSD